MDGLLLEVKSLWLLGTGEGLGTFRDSRPTEPRKLAETIFLVPLRAEVSSQVAAGPASSPSSVAEAASSVLVSRDFLGRLVYSLDNLFSLFKRKSFRKGGGCGGLFLSWMSIPKFWCFARI